MSVVAQRDVEVPSSERLRAFPQSYQPPVPLVSPGLSVSPFPIHRLAAVRIVAAVHADFVAVIYGRASGEGHLQSHRKAVAIFIAAAVGQKANRVVAVQRVIHSEIHLVRVQREHPVGAPGELRCVYFSERQPVTCGVTEKVVHRPVEASGFYQLSRITPGLADEHAVRELALYFIGKLLPECHGDFVGYIQPPAIGAALT